MFDRLPRLQTLRAFEATARLMSMTLAAEELHVTHGAVSRHIKTLENHLGGPLFRRLTRRIVLTDAGAEFHFAVARLLGELTREAESLRGHDSLASMTISTSVSFASKWLAPRLHRFKAMHPELDVHLDVTDRNVDLDDGQVDAAVRYGGGRYPRVQSERILEETVTPVCSPSYREEVGGLTDPARLTRCTLLHEDRMLANWEQWFVYANVERSRRGRGPAYSHGSMATEAAIRGEGVALGRSALVGDDIAAGRLRTIPCNPAESRARL
ncbi:LysR substrate-binding domain-containing protein [Caballeronia zhejiangensis]|uniref:LysR substrate-binding domain-containing protein n=1 Tax=Caballeronia zhejiangensis TaxID=871203 RepID=UPI001F51EDD0|nr:LysR substrate-binding domain-containing protein [Caballeronia zhejiangensis]